MKIQILIDGKEVYSEEVAEQAKMEKPNFAAQFNLMHGAKEWDNNVALIQNWYYGAMSKTSWCATSLSYMANKLGVLDKIGGKNENVWLMMCDCRDSGCGQFFDKAHIPSHIEKNDILFWLWSGTEMNINSSKHVGVAEYDSDTNEIYCIGGNQKDKICTLKYDKKYLYAVYRL